MNKKINGWLLASLIAVGLQLIATVVLSVMAVKLNMIPYKYLNLAMIALTVLIMLTAVLACFSKIRFISVIMAVLLCAALSAGCFYLKITENALNHMIVADDEEEAMTFSLVIRSESYLVGDRSLEGKKIACVSNDSMKEYIEKAKEETNLKWADVEYITFSSYSQAVDALSTGEVDGLLLAESYRSMVETNYSEFANETVVLDSVSAVVEVAKEESESESEVESQQDLSENSFVMYLSGCDSRTTSAWDLKYGRSDVNILAVVNPLTKVVLLIAIPRDTYMTFSFNDNLPDKLTHASVWKTSVGEGPECSVIALEDFFDTEINYYAKIGFYAFVDAIDAMGGIDVYSAMDYYTVNGDEWGNYYHFTAGINHLDGYGALSFVRERYSIGGFEGDMQRNRNQASVINALIEKVLQPEILLRYSSILSAVEYNLMTDFPREEMASLVSMQLEDNASWNILTFSITGTTGYEICYSYDDCTPLPVLYANENEVALAKEYIAAVLRGETPEI